MCRGLSHLHICPDSYRDSHLHIQMLPVTAAATGSAGTTDTLVALLHVIVVDLILVGTKGCLTKTILEGQPHRTELRSCNAAPFRVPRATSRVSTRARD